MTRHPVVVSCALAVLLVPAASAQRPEAPVRSVLDPGVVTTRQQITPAGAQTVFAGRVYGVAFGAADADVYAVTNAARTPLYQINWRRNHLETAFADNARPGMQGVAWDEAGKRALVTAIKGVRVNGRNEQQVMLLAASGGELRPLTGRLGRFAAGGVGVAATGRRAVVALTFDDAVAVVDLTSGAVEGTVSVGIAPFTAVVDRAGTVAYVSNWGGRRPLPGEATQQTGHQNSKDQVVVDARGIASTGTISRVDLTALKTTATIAVGLHPTALAWDEAHARLYVANTNSDSISVIDTTRNTVVRTIALQPFQTEVHGAAPTSLTLDRDGARLYIACGGINAVAVVDTASGHIDGLIPTGWYPDDVALSHDGKTLAVGSLLGVGSGNGRSHGLEGRYVHANRGTVQIVPVPDAAQLASYTTAVAENNHLRLRGETGATARPAASSPVPLPVPARAGDPSLIDHVVYIIKENRTYDQVFGDVEKGNGDPSFVMYGRDVTANQHKLADQFVLLDNFFATGGNSGDGHQWVTQAAETAYAYWPGYAGRSYPFDGDDPLAPAGSGFIWDAALARKKTVEVFGEYAGTNGLPSRGRIPRLDEWKTGATFAGRFHTVAPIAPLNRILAADYPSYGLSVPDVVRAQILLNHLATWERSGAMPNLVIVQLPSDHTGGTSPGFSTPKAAMADNDLALGRIVEGLSHSSFWPHMAIFVVEDDAQDGVDHVDGHRTVALAVSPYIRRGAVDSTFYSQPSMLKTMELMLGLPTLSLFDMIANDMRPSFQPVPDLTPYDAVTPPQSIFEVNPAASRLRGAARAAALASERMDFAEPDAAPTDQLNRILWHDARGWGTPYPATVHSVFAPYALDQDDAAREEERRNRSPR